MQIKGKLNMTKIVSLMAMMTGTLLLVACGDENTTNVEEQVGIATVAKGDTLPGCSEENAGEMAFVADSAQVYYCDGETWNTLNGRDGKNGADGIDGVDGKDGDNGSDGIDGTDGKDGATGEKGAKGDAGLDGASCTAEALSDGSGYKVLCGGDSVGVVLNGTDGVDG